MSLVYYVQICALGQVLWVNDFVVDYLEDLCVLPLNFFCKVINVLEVL